MNGIDVSRWQGQIDWRSVKKNVQFAIIKLGGSDDGLYMDGMAYRNTLHARDVGILRGFYFYLGGVHTPQEEVQHIKNLVSKIGGLKPGELLVLDWEERRAGFNEVGYLTAIVEGMSRAGLPTPLIYMNLHYVQSQDWSNLVRRNCGLWVAAWGNNDAVPQKHEVPGSDEWPFWAIWQYSSTGSVPGIHGRVDLNKFNGDAKQFQAYGLKGSFKMPEPIHVEPPARNPDKYAEYVVKAGDTLTHIANRFGMKWQDLYALNRDRVSHPNKIFPGQKLRTWKGGSKSNPPLPTSTHAQRYHTVQNGENLSVIAAKYKVSSWHTIYDLNKKLIGSDPNRIYPGQKLRIP